MSGCCGDYRCRRRTPVGLYRADFSGAVYAVTRYVTSPADRAGGRYRAVERHEVTDQVTRLILANPEWAAGILGAVCPVCVRGGHDACLAAPAEDPGGNACRCGHPEHRQER